MHVASLVDRNVDSPLSEAGPRGRATLHVTRIGDQSVVTRAYAESPLRLLTPGNHGSAAWVYTSTYGGGLVDGDRLHVDVTVGCGAAAMCSTQASTKVYRGNRGASADLSARVEADGLLVSIPDPVVCFGGAKYTQRQSFDLAAGASLVHLDWLSCGRLAFGERWAFDSYRSSLEIRVGGRLVCFDGLTLAADEGSIGERFDRFNVIATVALVGPACGPIQHVVDTDRSRSLHRADVLQMAAPLGQGAGVLLRLADVSLERAAATVRTWLAFLPACLGDDPWIRKW